MANHPNRAKPRAFVAIAGVDFSRRPIATLCNDAKRMFALGIDHGMSHEPFHSMSQWQQLCFPDIVDDELDSTWHRAAALYSVYRDGRILGRVIAANQ